MFKQTFKCLFSFLYPHSNMGKKELHRGACCSLDTIHVYCKMIPGASRTFWVINGKTVSFHSAKFNVFSIWFMWWNNYLINYFVCGTLKYLTFCFLTGSRDARPEIYCQQLAFEVHSEQALNTAQHLESLARLHFPLKNNLTTQDDQYPPTTQHVPTPHWLFNYHQTGATHAMTTSINSSLIWLQWLKWPFQSVWFFRQCGFSLYYFMFSF